MKLRNKLIPLLTVAATATTIAPLATSCTKSSEIKMIDIMNGYTPTIERAKAQSGLTKEAIFDIYVSRVKENPEIMTQDLAWYEAQALPVRLYELKSQLINKSEDPEYESLLSSYGLYVDSIDQVTITPKDLKFGIVNPTFKEVTIVNPKTNKEEKHMLVSMDMAYHFDYDVVANGYNVLQGNAPQTFYRHYTNHLSVSYKNVPISISYGTIGDTYPSIASGIPFQFTGLWNIQTNAWKTNHDWMLNKIEDWDYKFNRTSYCVDTLTDYENNKTTMTYDESASGDINTVARLKAYKETARPSDLLSSTFDFGSYFLYDLVNSGETPAAADTGVLRDSGEFGSVDNMRFYLRDELNAEDIRLSFTGYSYDEPNGEGIPLDYNQNATLVSDTLTLKIYHPNDFGDISLGTPTKNVWLNVEFTKGSNLYFSDPANPNAISSIAIDQTWSDFWFEGKITQGWNNSATDTEKTNLNNYMTRMSAYLDNNDYYVASSDNLICSIPAGSTLRFKFKGKDANDKYLTKTFTQETILFTTNGGETGGGDVR